MSYFAHRRKHFAFPYGCVAYYKLDEASGAVIDAVNGYNGTNNGATPNVTGKINTAYDFDGLVDFINLDTLVTPLATTTQGTWTAWVNLNDVTTLTTEYIISFGATTANEVIFIRKQVSTEALRAQMRVGSVTQWDITTDSSAFASGSWVHIAIVQDGISPVLYVNNVAVSQTITVSTDTSSWFNNTSLLDNARLGCLEFNSFSPQNFLNGLIDEIGFWKRPLTATERSNVYNNSYGKTYPS